MLHAACCMHEFGIQTGISRSRKKLTGKAKMESGISTDSQGPFPVCLFLSVWIPVCTSCRPGKSRFAFGTSQKWHETVQRLLLKWHELVQRLLCQTGSQNQMNSMQNLISLCCKGEKKEKRVRLCFCGSSGADSKREKIFFETVLILKLTQCKPTIPRSCLDTKIPGTSKAC